MNDHTSAPYSQGAPGAPTLAAAVFMLFLMTIPASMPLQGAPAEQAAEQATKQADEQATSSPVVVSAAANSWVVDGNRRNRRILGESGIHNWSDRDARIRTYFKTTSTGSLAVALRAKAPSGSSTVRVTVGDQSADVAIDSADWTTVEAGTFELAQPGYHYVQLQGLEKSDEYFADIESILLSGAAAEDRVYRIRDDVYWGRRGPSVHLGFSPPEDAGRVVYFHSEITVPEGQDVLGSYFMANGFSQGYFGIQVNSPSERRVLFSVWSPYQTDNPRDIPADQRVVMLKKGDDVYTGEFGNEGSGGQSYLRYPWKAGNTYRFLIRGVPTGDGATDFTAWFFPPEEDQWKLIASFRRPKTDTHLTGLHSFLENFMTETGDQSRMAHYGNQWIYDSEGQWHELTRARFTADATARKQARLDYAGGAEGQLFFLKNCGFFSETTPIDSRFQRTPLGTQPQIDFESLP